MGSRTKTANGKTIRMVSHLNSLDVDHLRSARQPTIRSETKLRSNIIGRQQPQIPNVPKGKQ